MGVSINMLTKADSLHIEKMKETIEECINILLPDEKFLVTLTICDNEYIKMLNSKFRNNDSETDVLSFPLLESSEAGKVIYDDLDVDFDTGEVMLGDIVVSYSRAQSQAMEYGHTVMRELCYLTVHSMLHLVGYDHTKEQERKMMRKKEEEILKKMGACR